MRPVPAGGYSESKCLQAQSIKQLSGSHGGRWASRHAERHAAGRKSGAGCALTHAGTVGLVAAILLPLNDWLHHRAQIIAGTKRLHPRPSTQPAAASMHPPHLSAAVSRNARLASPPPASSLARRSPMPACDTSGSHATLHRPHMKQRLLEQGQHLSTAQAHARSLSTQRHRTHEQGQPLRGPGRQQDDVT